MKEYIYSRFKMVFVTVICLLLVGFVVLLITLDGGSQNLWSVFLLLIPVFLLIIYNEWNSVVQLDSHKIVRISRTNSISILIKDIVELKKYKFLNWYLVTDRNNNKMFIDSTFNDFSDLIRMLKTYMEDNKNL